MVVALGNNEYAFSLMDDAKKMLTLGRKYYIWDDRDDGTAKLTRVMRESAPLKKIEKGNYWLFRVIADERFTTGIHLSLVSEKCQWWSFLASGEFNLKNGESCILSPTPEHIAKPQKSQLKIISVL
jgi:hypothetical protein